MATTAYGLPYPAGTDFVVDGDNAIRALAESTDLRPYALAYRSTSAGAPSNAIYTEISAATFWTGQVGRGIAPLPAAGQGFIVPYAGRWLAHYDLRFAGPMLVGLAINLAGNQGAPKLYGASTAPSVQGIALCSGAVVLKLNALDKVNIYALSAAAGVAWLTDGGSFGIHWMGA